MTARAGCAAAAAAIVLLVGAAAAVIIARRPAASRPAASPAPSAHASPGRGPASATATLTQPPPGRSTAPRLDPAEPETVETGLTIESDVHGASVFVDRVFKGQAPVTLHDVTPGTHRLNVSAEGYEGYAGTIEVTGEGQRVMARLKEVRLDAAVAVVHRHRFGSCRGRLSASLAGLRFRAEEGDDSFAVPLAGVERLETDYQDKRLQLKVKGGRTYNFEEPSGNADALLTFQQAVEKVRSRR